MKRWRRKLFIVTRKALGKGLNALISDRSKKMTDHVQYIELSRIHPSPHQPRRAFDKEALEQLAATIKAQGVISPVTVRPVGDTFELVAGERRWRAAKLAGQNTIPALVRRIKDPDAMQIALIENVQRKDLNPMELAAGYELLMERYGLRQEDLAKQIGKDRATISNSVRLLKLPETVQELIRQDQLSAGHAKVLLSIKSTDLIVKLAMKTVSNGWSVRTLENTISSLKSVTSSKPAQSVPTDPILESALDSIRRCLSTKVSLARRKKGGGKLVLEFFSEDDLIRILDLLGASNRG
jgi:ParB family transcriptional regulator, chromosome partitioning protein